MKALFFVILIYAGFSKKSIAQDSDHGAVKSVSCLQCEKTWLTLRGHLLNKDLAKSVLFFTDSLAKHFQSFEVSSLKALINEKWFKDPYFITSLKRENYKFQQRGNTDFRIHITVSYPYQQNEEGDHRTVYVLDFKLFKSGYKIYMINIAG
ncbi:hypothetical protein [Longitalea luteola]|uniref:hypothetical protein n=1 Tax=Longitalea luteola TaxID=2812563 RepID=UPI001A9708E6|nr:hypothetical protein [Longitalea luteola]